VHVLVFVIAALIPSEKVVDIPVRALTFKLGDEHRIVASSTAAAPAVVSPVLEAVSTDSWQAAPNVPAPVIPAPLVAKPTPVPVPKPTPVKAKPVEKPAPAIAPTPQQYVREVGAAPALPTSAPNGQTSAQSLAAQRAEAVRARYEQQISGWIKRHNLYPQAAGGREGRVVVRMRIDRAGNVRYYAIEKSSGLAVFDEAALDMIRRVNPVPAVPEDYPAGNLVEFLIPISFKAPL
jgi:protein TonB